MGRRISLRITIIMRLVSRMTDSLFVDTGYIIALVNKNDQHHTAAVALSRRFDSNSVLLTDAILLEVGNALSRFDRQTVSQIIEDFLEADESTVIHMTPVLFQAAFSLYKRHQDKQWGMVDCLSFVVMRAEGISTALAFDRHFVQAGFSLARV